MKCLLCDKDYINLGVHLRHKHHVDPADYKEQFGMMKTTPLVDESLSHRLSKSMKQRLLDPDWLAETTARCKENAANGVGISPAEYSQAGRDKVADRNRKNHADRLNRLAPVVAKILKEKKTLADVKREIGMGGHAIWKIIKMGKAVYSKEVAALVATERRVLSRAKNKEKNT